MDHTDAFYLEVIRSPERKDEEKTDEEEGPGRVVFLVLSHWFVRWSRSCPDVNVRRGELRSVHSSGALSMAASVRRLRKASMMRRRKQADRVSACRLLFRHSRSGRWLPYLFRPSCSICARNKTLKRSVSSQTAK